MSQAHDMATATTSHIKPVEPSLLIGDLIPPQHPLFGVVWMNPQRISGTACFYGTRVPLQNLFDYLEGGESLDTFLLGFPGVTREQAIAVLNIARKDLLADLQNP